jgi:hypothetical protein
MYKLWDCCSVLLTLCADDQCLNFVVQLKNAADKSEDKKRKKRS